MSDAVARARELLSKATPGPWSATHDGDLEPPRVWSDYDDELVAKVCPRMPYSECIPDAKLIAAAPTLLAELTDEVDRLRALTTVDDAMVERAARAVYGVAFADAAVGWGMASQSMRDTCRTLADAALEAALGVQA